jgi:hypothetical protein
MGSLDVVFALQVMKNLRDVQSSIFLYGSLLQLEINPTLKPEKLEREQRRDDDKYR